MAHCINRKEGSDLKRRASFENEEIQLKRAREDQKEKQMLVMKAEEFLTHEKKRKPKDLSPSALENQDVSFLSDLFKDAVDGKYKFYIFIKTYSIPNFFVDKDWKWTFYSKVDADDEIGRKLTRIEEHIFKKNKKEIVKFLKEPWVGTEHQNDVADTKVR